MGLKGISDLPISSPIISGQRSSDLLLQLALHPETMKPVTSLIEYTVPGTFFPSVVGQSLKRG